MIKHYEVGDATKNLVLVDSTCYINRRRGSRKFVAIDFIEEHSGSQHHATHERNYQVLVDIHRGGVSFATSGKGSGMVGYNVQSAVDTKNHLIVAHEVTNVGHDRSQLAPMAERARVAMDTEELTAVADRGYFTGTQIVACEDEGITAYVAKPLTSGSKKKGLFTKQDFIYSPQRDHYRCPAGEHLTWRFDTVEHGLNLHVYFASVMTCRACPKKAQCTEGSHQRRIRRWEREDVLDEMQARLDEAPQMMQMRRQTVEHPFGTLKAWMGATHFLMKTLPRVSTEMSLHVLAYNMKRVMNLLGVGALIEEMRV